MYQKLPERKVQHIYFYCPEKSSDAKKRQHIPSKKNLQLLVTKRRIAK